MKWLLKLSILLDLLGYYLPFSPAFQSEIHYSVFGSIIPLPCDDIYYMYYHMYLVLLAFELYKNSIISNIWNLPFSFKFGFHSNVAFKIYPIFSTLLFSPFLWCFWFLFCFHIVFSPYHNLNIPKFKASKFQNKTFQILMHQKFCLFFLTLPLIFYCEDLIKLKINKYLNSFQII